MQTHKRFTSEQVGYLLGAYVDGHIERIEFQEALAIGKSGFSGLLRECPQASPKAAAGRSPRMSLPGSRRRPRRRSRVLGGRSWRGVLGGIRLGCAYRDASQSAASSCLDIPRAAVWEGAHPQGLSEFSGGEPNDQR